MAKPVLTFLIVCCLFLSSCYREKRVKPVEIPRSANLPYEGYIYSFKFGAIASVDSNGNGVRSSFDLQFQLVFNRVSKFKYTVFLENSNYKQNSLHQISSSDWQTAGYNLDYVGKIRINADSLRDYVEYQNDALSLSIKFEDEYGRVIEVAPEESSSSYTFTNGKVLLPSYYVETLKEDQKFDSYFTPQLSDYQDINQNGYYSVANRIKLSFYQLPTKEFSLFAKVFYSEQNAAVGSRTLLPFAHSDPFKVKKGANATIESLLHFDVDTQSIVSYTQFVVQLIDATTGEKVKEYSLSTQMETYTEDKRIYKLDAFQLQDIVDHDHDSYASSYQAVVKVSASDLADMPLFAKVYYKVYGLNTAYNAYTNVLWSSKEEVSITLAGNTFLSKGLYDFKIEIYAYDARNAQGKGYPLATFSPDNTPDLQSLRLEKTSEDALP